MRHFKIVVKCIYAIAQTAGSSFALRMATKIIHTTTGNNKITVAINLSVEILHLFSYYVFSVT